MNRFGDRTFRALILAFAVAAGCLLVVALAYSALVVRSWLKDRHTVLTDRFPLHGDYSHLTNSTPRGTIVPDPDPVVATRQLQELVRQAAAAGEKVSIAGSAHSMGGHTLSDGAWRIQMRTAAFQHIGPVRLENGVATVRVGAGATWHRLLGVLDRAGWSVAIMQSNDDFTVGGSVSVNCHGWEAAAPPIASTVTALTLLLADGSIFECRRDRPADAELFRAVCGGYGLCGIILEVELQLVPNALYRAQEFPTDLEHFAKRFESLVSQHNPPPALAYGRLSIAPGPWFLRDARIICFEPVAGPADSPPLNTVAENGGSYGLTSNEIGIARAVFRASVGNAFGKLGRWTIERWHGQTHRVLSRNGILQTPSTWFANRDPRFTEILHEYFVPPDRLAEFLDQIRPVLRETGDVDLLNITLRKVQRDGLSQLDYAREDVFGLVFLFHYAATSQADGQMAGLTERLLDAALACGGTYYLRYRPHASVAQFHRAYPRAAEFLAAKRRYDPTGIFQNEFYARYFGDDLGNR